LSLSVVKKLMKQYSTMVLLNCLRGQQAKKRKGEYLMFWKPISLEEYDVWMGSLQAELEDYELLENEEGVWQTEYEIKNLASLYAEQIKGIK
jgi:hypothetical protein